MKGLFKMHKGEKGFTLVELLVVFTLLAVLAAIMIPNVASFLNYGHTQAEDTELSIVQTAMDAMMAVADLSLVNEVTVATNNMAAFPGGGHVLYPDYLRFATTHCTYTCTTGGDVAQVSDW